MRKKIIIVVTALVLILLGLNFGLPLFFKSEIEGFLSKKLPAQIEVSYETLTMAIIRGNVTLTDVKIIIKDSSQSKVTSDLKIESVHLYGLHYWDVINDKELTVDGFKIITPKGFHQPTKIIPRPKTNDSKTNKINAIFLEDFQIENGAITILDSETDSIKVQLPKMDLSVYGAEYHLNSDDSSQAFIFKNFQIELDSVFLKASTYDDLRISKLSGNLESTKIENFSFQTNLSTEEFSKVLTQERDHYDLKISSISIEDIQLPHHKDSLQYLFKSIEIKQPILNVYRDKLVTDEHSLKPMLSEVIRTIPLQIKADSLMIRDAYVKYQERVHTYNKGGYLFFDNANILIPNFTNIDPEKYPLNVSVSANFMGDAPLKGVWTFHNDKPNEAFTFKGEVTNVYLKEFKVFTVPNLNTYVEGVIHKLYFTIDGNEFESSIDIKARYNDIKATVLNKSHHQRNKFFSSVANLIVKKDSKTKKHLYREAKADTKRDPEKSNFNYLYANIKNGLIKIFI